MNRREADANLPAAGVDHRRTLIDQTQPAMQVFIIGAEDNL
ncbi:hypothetical protein ACP26L_29755 [Paenibacillus sp. S-38]